MIFALRVFRANVAHYTANMFRVRIASQRVKNLATRLTQLSCTISSTFLSNSKSGNSRLTSSYSGQIFIICSSSSTCALPIFKHVSQVRSSRCFPCHLPVSTSSQWDPSLNRVRQFLRVGLGMDVKCFSIPSLFFSESYHLGFEVSSS